MASSAADRPPLSSDFVASVRELLLADGSAALPGGARLTLRGGTVHSRRRSRFERTYPIGHLDQALDFAEHGDPTMRGPGVPRTPGKPFGWRSPKRLASQTRALHKQGIIKDIPVPEVLSDK